MNKKSLSIVAVALSLIAALTLGFLSLNSTTFAQGQMVSTSRTIHVNGVGVINAVPDVLQATLGVETQDANLSNALAENNARMTALIVQLETLGVDELDIQTTNFFINEIRNRDGEITAFLVVNNVNVILRDLDTAGSILDQAIQAGANRVSNIQLAISDAEPLLVEARALAVANARDKANQLAGAAEMFLGNPISINESGGFQPTVVARAAVAESFDSSVPISGGQLAITVNVSITYEMF